MRIDPKVVNASKRDLVIIFYNISKNLNEMVYLSDCSINRTLDAPKSPVKKQFISPYWPSGYRLNTTCGWYIVAPENHIVDLFIHLTWKELSENSVQIYDVEGSKLSPVPLAQFNFILSKFRIVYILLKIVNFNKTDYIGARRIHVSYSAIKSGTIIKNK